jgi:hypothetical protein
MSRARRRIAQVNAVFNSGVNITSIYLGKIEQKLGH